MVANQNCSGVWRFQRWSSFVSTRGEGEKHVLHACQHLIIIALMFYYIFKRFGLDMSLIFAVMLGLLYFGLIGLLMEIVDKKKKKKKYISNSSH
ncbi:hypothetical protein AtNW77_Chr1g0035661 [Arabidopsis thaliana]